MLFIWAGEWIPVVTVFSRLELMTQIRLTAFLVHHIGPSTSQLALFAVQT
jgi:hypothetical protein